MSHPRFEIPVSTTRNRWRLYAGGFAATALIVCVLEVVPRAREAYSLGQQWQSFSSGATTDAQQNAERNRLVRERAELREELGVHDAHSDGLSHLTRLMGTLQQAAEESGVVVVRIEPSEAERQGTKSIQPLRTIIRGSGHSAGQFVDEIERSGALLTVRTFVATGPEFDVGLVEATL